MANKDGVTAIPCSEFYDPGTKQLGENYVRFAYCKTEEMIKSAEKRLAQWVYNIFLIFLNGFFDAWIFIKFFKTF